MIWHVPQNLKLYFISGYTFYKKCKWSVCPRYKQVFIPEQVQPDDLVFLNLDYVEHFVNFISKNRPKSKFRILTHNSDRDFTYDLFLKLKDFCNKIYAINCTFQDEMVVKIPIGFNDQSTEFLDSQDFNFIEKKNLIYLNFRSGHHFSRRDCVDYFNQFDWVELTDEKNYMPVNDFYEKLKTFKYCISPRGAGIDTHRLYESLMFGVIPIVKKSELDDLYINLPILLVDDWSDITKEFLEKNYEKNLSEYFDWKKNNQNWYLPDYWIK